MGCFLLLPINDVGVYSQAATQSDLSSVKQQVEQIGVGAEVKLKLAGGEKVHGKIETIEDQDFVLGTGQQSAHRRIHYNQVARVNLARLVYRATGVPDPIAVSRVVEGLSVGHHIVVRTTEGQEYRGNIQVISREHFVIMPDHQTTSVQIAYTQVRYVEQNLSKGSKIAVVVAIVVVVAVVVSIVVIKVGCKGYC
jgi:ribosome maturation factor RimP